MITASTQRTAKAGITSERIKRATRGSTEAARRASAADGRALEVSRGASEADERADDQTVEKALHGQGFLLPQFH